MSIKITFVCMSALLATVAGFTGNSRAQTFDLSQKDSCEWSVQRYSTKNSSLTAAVMAQF